MLNDLPPLGFAIPAYRRPAHLDLALQSIVPQARELNAPIYIPDDSCDQTNAAVVARWKNGYPNIIHDINEHNLGIDRNIDRAIVGCPAKYVHVIGDDDIILPGFAGRVMQIITRAKPGHIVCSYMYVANDYRVIDGKGVIPAHGSGSSLRKLLPRYGWALGFIGAHVFCRDRFVSCAVEGFGTYFHHLIRLIQYMAPDEELGLVEEPLVGNRADDESTPTWSRQRLAVVFGLEKAFTIGMRDRYSESEIEVAIGSARRNLGYAQFFRLLYWAALAERSGDGARYWESLARVVPRARYKRLHSVPKILYAPLRELVAIARLTKRYVRDLKINNQLRR